MSEINRDPATSLTGSARIQELDGLRGFAILLVLVTHCLNVVTASGEPRYVTRLIAFVSGLKSFAWSGVDLFFVLSGFLIVGKLLDTRESPDYFKQFYFRRARRILPAYMLFLGLMAISYEFIYPAHRFAMAWPFAHPLPWYSYLTFTANFWMAYHNSYGAWGLAVLWSLAIEEQFYLVSPFLIRLVRREQLPRVLAIGILSSLLLRCALQFIRHDARLALYVLLPCRIDAFLWGVLAAYALRTPGGRSFLAEHKAWLWRMFFLLAAGIGLASFSASTNIHSIATTTIGYDWLDVFYLTGLVLVLLDRQSWLGSFARRPWLIHLGLISYSLYLIHYAVYGLSMGYLLGRSGPIQSRMDLCVALFSIVLSIGLATLSWEFLEKPILQGQFLAQIYPAQLFGRKRETASSQYLHEVPGWGESFLRRVNCEDFYRESHTDLAEAHESIGSFMGRVYDRKRRYSAIEAPFSLRAAQSTAVRTLATTSTITWGT